MTKKAKQPSKTRKSAAVLRVSGQKHAKVAISIPAADLSKIEEICHEHNLSRSRFMLLAVRQWFDNSKEQSLIEQYIRGYQTTPEDIALVKAMQPIQSRVLAKESW